MWLTPTWRALNAAARFVRANGLMPALRLFARGLVTLGPAGVIRRAAAETRAREDDARYWTWLRAKHQVAEPAVPRPTSATSTSTPKFSVIVPVFNTEPHLLTRCIDSVRAQSYGNWELCICDDGSTNTGTVGVIEQFGTDTRVRVTRLDRNLGIAEASNAALASADGDFIVLLDHDDELAPDALAEVGRTIASQPALDVVYTDEDKIDHAGHRSQPHFKPDWSPELLRSCMYVSHLLVVRRSVVQDIGGFRRDFEGAQDYDLLLRVAQRSTRIAHIPRVLYHWRVTPGSAAESQLSKPWAFDAGARALADDARVRGMTADVTSLGAGGHYRVRYPIRGNPRIAILVDCDDAGASRTWLRRLMGRTAHPNVQYICAHRSRVSDRDAPISDRQKVINIQLDRSCNMPLAFNAAADAATADHLILLTGGVLPISTDWIDALLEFSQQDEIGVVGPLILGAEGTIESAGIVVLDGQILDAFKGEPAWTMGHMGNAVGVRNCSALSDLCLMTRLSVFREVGRFDPRLGTCYAVDYGFRVRESGRRVLATPHATMRVSAHVTRPNSSNVELSILRERWGGLLAGDPYYNPNFERYQASFRLPPSEPVQVQAQIRS